MERKEGNDGTNEMHLFAVAAAAAACKVAAAWCLPLPKPFTSFSN